MSEDPEVEVIGRLMALAAQYGLEELRVEEAGLKVTLRAPHTGALPEEDLDLNVGRYHLWQPPSWRGNAAAAETTAPGRSETAVPLHAPLTGTFYRSPSPDAPPFVEVGAAVELGQQVGTIEAMKVFSPIEADQAGTVVEIVAQNGQLVQHGDVLLYVEPA